MSESQWDDKVKAFLKKTGDDLKRAGTDIRSEAERLMKDVQSPEGKEKVREGLKSFTAWARKTAEEVAGVVETGVKKAETAVRTAVDTTPPAHASDPSPEAPAPGEHVAATEAPPPEALRHDTPVDTPAVEDPAPEKPKKSIGKKKGSTKAKAASASKKPLGKKR
jgi:hypothetical protein